MIINKIIQKRCLILVFGTASCLCSCLGKKSENQQESKVALDSLNRPENIKLVSAIARVEPAGGLISLSADVSGIVLETYKNEGDTIKKGDTLFMLDRQQTDLELKLAKQEIRTQQSRVSGDLADIKQYEASLREKDEDLRVTGKLAATGADTRQNVLIKEKEREVIAANLHTARARADASAGELKILKTRLQQASRLASDRIVSVQQNGIIVSLDAKPGTAINALAPYGTLAKEGDILLHGEIDEMFASRVKIGQEVDISYVGNRAVIATGKVIYLSAILSDKSLFYEKTGESTDRRVRQFKVALSTPANLLINAKMECKIKIQ